MIISVGFCVFYANNGISSSMELKEKQSLVQNLRSEKEELVKELVSLGSISKIYEDVKSTDMIAVKTAEYIFVPSETFAKK